MNKLFAPSSMRLFVITVALLSSTASYAVTWIPVSTGDITIFVPYEPPSGTPVVEEYDYDALGRLRKVKLAGATDTEYCYDRAGNRTSVVKGGIGDDECEAMQPLPAPTGLTAGTHAGNGYNASWQAVEGATHYIIRLSNATEHRVDGTFYGTPSGVSPKWVRACDYYTCSLRAYF